MCISRCLSDDTLKAVGAVYLVSMSWEIKYPTYDIGGKCGACIDGVCCLY